MPAIRIVDYSGVIPVPTFFQEPVMMARYLHIAFGALLLVVAGASAYELCSENVLNQASIYVLR
jgi:cytochrome bd-type quinol oxidase subunit 1